MPKKKTAKRKTTRNPEGADKTRFELRFDNDLYNQVKRLADDTGISVNQLMQGLARWGVDRLRPGEPTRDENGWVSVKPQEGCLWAGKTGSMTGKSEQEIFEDYGEDGPQTAEECEKKDLDKRGDVYIFLDFTERRVVRDDV